MAANELAQAVPVAAMMRHHWLPGQVPFDVLPQRIG
jgi:hypothetical protein